MSPSRLRLALILLTGLPIFAIGWLGLRLAAEDEARGQAEIHDVSSRRLADWSSGVHEALQRREREIALLVLDWPTQIEALRAALRRAPAFHHALVLDEKGGLAFPPATGNSEEERAFIERTRSLWSPGTLGSARPRDVASDVIAPVHLRGVVSFFWGEGLNIVSWHRLPDGRVVGVELDRARLLADVMTSLPSTEDEESRTELVDERGALLYVFGGANLAGPLVERPLGEPFTGWTLRTHLPLSVTRGGRWAIWSTAGAVALVLVGVAVSVMRESGRALREASQRVSFVKQVSHELKTPLTNIRLYAELLEQSIGELNDEASEPARAHLAVVVHESTRLSRMIANVLMFARSQREKPRLRRTPCVVDDVVAEVLSAFAPSFSSRGLKVEQLGAASARVVIDADVVGQVLGNLLSNAEKYGAGGGVVEVQLEQVLPRTRIVVSDRGPGLPRADVERVFDAFVRLDNRLSEGVTGTGIGLTIARDLARLHGGEVRYLQSPSGIGAHFEFTFDSPPPGEPRMKVEANAG